MPQPNSMLSFLQTIETGDNETDRDLRLLCETDWTSTSLGSMCSWPRDLLTLIYLAMLSPQPQFFFLGDDHTFLYNSAYGRLLRDHHPAYFGKPLATLERIQTDAGVMVQLMQTASENRRPALEKNKLFLFDNHGSPEEVYLSTNLVLLPPHLHGYHVTTEDTTSAVLRSRRDKALESLISVSKSAQDLPGLWRGVSQSFSESPDEFPFAMIYAVETQDAQRNAKADRAVLTLQEHVGEFGCPLPRVLVFGSSKQAYTECVRRAISSRSPVKTNIPDNTLPVEWCRALANRGCHDPCNEAVIFTSSVTPSLENRAVLVVGVTPRKPSDHAYQTWIREIQRCIADRAAEILAREAREAEAHQAEVRAQNEIDIRDRERDLQKEKVIIADGKVQRVMQMAETIDLGFFDYLPTGELIHGNDAFFRLSGYPRDPELNKQLTFLDYCMEEDIELIMAQWQKLVAGQPITFEMRWKNNTPTGQWVVAACTPIFDEEGNLASVSGCTTDISAQKRVEEDAIRRAEALEQVKLSQTRLLRFTDNAPIGIVINNTDGRPSYINKSWFDITGHSERSTEDVDIASICYDEDVLLIKTKEEEAIQHKKPVEFQARLKRQWSSSDGIFHGQAWVSIIFVIEFGEDGAVNHIMSTWSEISYSKFSEHVQRMRLEEAIEAKRQSEAFIDMTSHEIRNPLGATMHCADLVHESLAEMERLVGKLALPNDNGQRQSTRAKLDEQFESSKEAVDTILACSMHQKRITDDILSLSKLDSNLLKVSPLPVRAAGVLENVSNTFSVEAHRDGVTLTTQLDQSLDDLNVDWVTLDPGRVLQVLVNLITNALKFTKGTKGDRTVSVRMGASKHRPVHLSVPFAPVQGLGNSAQPEMTITDDSIYVWFSVTDTGCGMNEQEQQRMFSRFSQASIRTYNKYGGSGLGLFISKKLTELQGGEIGFTSEPGVGSRFAFYVSAQATAAPPSDQSPGMRPRTRSPLKLPAADQAILGQSTPSKLSVLVVEDNAINLSIMKKHLVKNGYDVHTAVHGQDALDYLKSTKIWKQSQEETTASLEDVNIILMDIEMPVMDGLVCSKHIRDLQRSGEIVRHIPIIAVSANARPEQTKLAMDAGMDDFVTKPFRMPELTPKITRLVEADQP